MSIPISRVVGIYNIQCKKNDMIYIGKSEWLGLRWGSHLAALLSGTHANDNLQKDFDKYGFDSFSFSVLEIVSEINDLSKAEANWIGMYDESMLYNIKPAICSENNPAQVDEFISYVNSKWLVPQGVSGFALDKYKIWRDEDKNEIVNKFIEYKMSLLPRRSITFIKVIGILEGNLGYCVNEDRQRFDGRNLRYRLIVSFNEKENRYKKAIPSVDRVSSKIAQRR